MSETAGSRVASQRVAEVLRERILSGRLRPGTRIKPDELAEGLSLPRTSIRCIDELVAPNASTTSRRTWPPSSTSWRRSARRRA